MKKIIFITGTSTGFGKLMVQTLSKAGHTIIAGMRGTATKNKVVAQELNALPNVEVTEIEITDDESVNTAIHNAINKYGKIDVLVNNAAMTGYGLLEGYSVAQFQKMMDVNLYSVLRTYQAVLPSMRAEKNGLVINITSGASGFTVPFMIPYLTSKFGVEAITEGLQDELKDYGIDNVSIQPGVYPTEMNSGVKTGINADKEDVIAAYGNAATEKFNTIGTALFGKMADFKMDPQVIADGVLKLVEMEKGKHPLRYPIDAIAQGTDHEFINVRSDIKVKWAAKYGL
jgi:NAD(P)-dependent dehydrogenase (short-subunit alcohol dehydrogenase family)